MCVVVVRSAYWRYITLQGTAIRQLAQSAMLAETPDSLPGSSGWRADVIASCFVGQSFYIFIVSISLGSCPVSIAGNVDNRAVYQPLSAEQLHVGAKLRLLALITSATSAYGAIL